MTLDAVVSVLLLACGLYALLRAPGGESGACVADGTASRGGDRVAARESDAGGCTGCTGCAGLVTAASEREDQRA